MMKYNMYKDTSTSISIKYLHVHTVDTSQYNKHSSNSTPGC